MQHHTQAIDDVVELKFREVSQFKSKHSKFRNILSYDLDECELLSFWFHW